MDPDAASAMDQALRAIFERHRDELVQQVADIEDAVAAALDDDLDDDVIELATRQAHRLSGTGGMFGMHRTSAMARELESAFMAPEPSEARWIMRVSELTVSLAAAVEEEASRRATPPDEQPGPAETGPRLALGLGDDDFAAAVASTARQRGFRVELLEAEAGRPSDSRPDVAVVRATGRDGVLDRLAPSAAEAAEPVPALVVSSPDSRLDRVELARRGAHGFLTEPLRAGQVVDAVEDLIGDQRLQGVTIVAVDDDPSVLDVVEELLTEEGIVVETVQDPSDVWDVLQRVDPDLLVLDIEMPGIDGIELCRVIRSDPRWDQLSILFLTAHTDHETVTAVFEVGADDYVAKPLNPHELVVRIANRLDRIRLLRQRDDVDAVTGAASRQQAHRVFQRLAAQAREWRQALSVAVVDLDDFRTTNDRLGRSVGDELLRSVAERFEDAFPAPALVARWGGQEFLVLMPGMSRADAVDRVARVIEEQRGAHPTSAGLVHLTFSAGVALAGEGGDAQDLHRASLAAAQALHSAKERGGDRVAADGAADRETYTHDVVVVEDDATLASVLGHALGTRGWRTIGIDDGDRAAALLAGDEPEVRARVIVLDWDLPGLDGPAVLRRMVDSHNLANTQVIMLTAHAQEEEVLRTLELGAADHVSKPFSIPVLMQRIRRAMAG